MFKCNLFSKYSLSDCLQILITLKDLKERSEQYKKRVVTKGEAYCYSLTDFSR